ncbi:OLC1v1001592C1 [Oldenlandia corymbosa var. corymbosa]|uniref:OLC1v1001592C1 n=1 Tax=Oldenlandia corymbosa var. corymbosa TaxID=529605 RepID=A0AAV1D774_OLDCO|nr:OLC1v1001592C1 [Oldenlandia corymbosa var. corymbosa]
MADAGIGVVAETLLNMVISLATEKINLVRGVKKELSKLQEQLEMIQAMQIQAHKQPISNQPVQLWLKKLQSVALDAQIVLEEFGYEVLRQKIEGRKRDKVRAFFSCSNPLPFRLRMGQKIKNVQQSIEDVYVQGERIISVQHANLANSPSTLNELRSRLTSPYVEGSQIVGRDDDVKEVIEMLINTNFEKDLPVVTIYGMGGQGKTTLAQLVYKHDKVRNSFDETIWVCVAEDFNVTRLLDEICQCATNTRSQLTNTSALVERLKGVLTGKKFLLVLDDVWNRDEVEWNNLRNCLLQIGDSNGSRILATTRESKVASTMGTSKYHSLGALSDDQSLELFKKVAFAEGGATETPQLLNIAQRILERCRGLPLAIKTMASLLRSCKTESDWSMIEQSETWSAYPEGDTVLAAIKLSYDHLPSLSLKQCFAYCAIFEKDTVIEKDRLIQLWIAQGLINPSKDEIHLQMEDIGSIYFDTLLSSSLFQDAEKDICGDIYCCKMHDLVHDVASKVSENYCYRVSNWRAVTKRIEASHVSIYSGERGMWKNLREFLPLNLRTLYLKGYEVDLPEDLFQSFTRLAALVVEDGGTNKLPKSIGKLKHLRLVDIEGTEITKLPMSFTKLYYLQTLRAHRCRNIPQRFGNLTNLRHICIEGLSGSLPELGQLTNLRTIPEFRCRRYRIEELEHLNNLRGTLIISGLHSGDRQKSAAKSNLSEKPGIKILELHWGKWNKGAINHVEVMESLKPHPNLKVLKIYNYGNPRFPSWMARENDLSSSLCNLLELELKDLVECESLPALGRLPCLKLLKLSRLSKVKRIGEEFYGWSNVDGLTDGGGSDRAEVITVFPALRVLYMEGMRSLEEWSDACEIIPTTHSTSSMDSVQVKAFPCLEKMRIYDVPELSAFPNLGALPSLGVLHIEDCTKLTISNAAYRDRGGFESIQKIRAGIDEDEKNQSESADDHVVSYIHPQQYPFYFPSLQRLTLWDCGELTAPLCSLVGSSVKSLTIRCCPRFWPKDLHHLIGLEELTLKSWGCEGDEELMPWPYPTISGASDHNLVSSLTSLTLDGGGLPKVKSLPSEIQFLSCLTTLGICGFEGLEILPEWLGNLTSLHGLRLQMCPNLKQLPSTELLQRLTYLDITGGGELSNRCKEGSGSEWHKIAHIPRLRIL